MHSAMTRTLCRVLIVMMAWMPFQVAQAGIISTEEAVASVQNERAAVLNLIQRADVASQLQAFGVNLATAKDRVAALTDEEVRSLAGKIDAVPAGGNWAAVMMVGVILWFLFWRR